MKGCQLNWRALNLHHLFMNFELIFISKEKCLLWGSAMQKNVSSWVLTFAFQLLFVVMPYHHAIWQIFLQYHRTKGGVPIFAFSSNASLCTTTSTQQSHTFENGLAVTLQLLNAKKYPAVWFALKKGPVRSKHSASLTSYQVPARESPIYR